MLSNTLRLNSCYLKIIHILHSRYHSKIIGQILKSKQKKKCVCVHEIIRLIIMKMKMKMKNGSRRDDINTARCRRGRRYSKYKKCLIIMMLICTKQHLSNFFRSFMKRLSNNEAAMKKSAACKKASIIKKTECMGVQTWMHFFKARTDCLVKMIAMLSRTTWISYQTSDKTPFFKKKSGHQGFL